MEKIGTMEKPVSSIMTTPVTSVRPDDSVHAVGEVLRRHDLSFVPVVDSGGTVVGILSVGDLLQFQASKRDPNTVFAWEICSYKPVDVAPDTPISEVARLMVGRRIHHVIVMENQQIAGVVSSLDFVKQYLS
jgi:CBS domain-containing protein